MRFKFFAAVLLMAFATAAQAETLNVPSQYPTIQAAIDAAEDGDTVQVAAGTYYENIAISKAVNVIGEGRDRTFLGTGSGWPADAVRITADGLTFSGFHVNGGIICYGASPVVEHNTITNTGANYYGIYADYDFGRHRYANPVIQNNLIMNCPDGIQLFWSRAVIRNNVIVLNSAYGVNVSWAWPVIENNTIANNGIAGIQNFYYSYATIRNNIIAGNGRYGIMNYYYGRSGERSYNVLANNAISNFASFVDSVAIEPDATEIMADPGFVNAPHWTSSLGWNPLGRNSVGINSGNIYGEDHSIGPFERGNFIQIGFDDRPRAVYDIDGSAVFFAPNVDAIPLSAAAPVRIVNYLGRKRDLNFSWDLAAGSPALNAGDPDPAFSNPDGTRNTIGFSGGPFANWK